MMHYVRHHELDRAQWDALIARAPNGLIYALSWYLDVVSPGWTAFVEEVGGRYVAGLPLPERTRLGFRYLRQPLFAQQLGLFSLAPATSADWQEVGRLLRRHFRFISHYAFNVGNPVPAAESGLARPGAARATYHLSLRPAYAAVAAGYHPARRRQLNQARRQGLTVEPTTDLEQLIRLFDRHTAPKIYGLIGEGHAYPLLRKLYQEAHQRGMAAIWQAKTATGEVVAGMLLLEYKNEVIYLFNAASAEGRATRAISLLLDSYFAAHAGSGLHFDFEAPEIPSLVQFYSSFGSVAAPYFTISYNRLPWPVRLLRAARMRFYRRR